MSGALGDCGRVTSERTSCGPTPAMTGWSMSPVADAAATGEPIVNLLGQPQAEYRDRRAGRAALIDTDDRNAQVPCDLDRDLGRQGAEATEQPVLASAVATGEVGPGGRDHPQVDPAAIAVPDIAINHVGTDGQADPAPRCGDNERGSPGVEAEPLPEDEVPLTIDLDRAIGQAKGQRVVEVPAIALDEPGDNPHPPMAAASTQMPQGRPVGPLGAGGEIGEQAVARVEHLGQGRQHGARSTRFAQNSVGSLEVCGDLGQLSRHLHCGDQDLHITSTSARQAAKLSVLERSLGFARERVTPSVRRKGARP